MSSYFLKSGNCFRVTSKEALDLHESLPVGNYIVKKNDMTGELYLEAIDAFELPSKVYGSCLKDADRILNTFNTRKSTTGVLLTGEKGSGKTLLAKEVSLAGAKLGIPTIVINTPFCGARLTRLSKASNSHVLFCLMSLKRFTIVKSKKRS